MSVHVNVFRPTFDGVSVQSSGSIVVKLASEDGEVQLYFMQASEAAVQILGHSPYSPVEQITHLVSAILQGAGFDSYEYERVGVAVSGDPVGEVWFDHPDAPVSVPDWLPPHLVSIPTTP